jgi:hypothetical protein
MTYDVTISENAPGTGSLRPIEADSPYEAAEVAAARLARRLGRRGAFRSLRQDCVAMDGSLWTYQAFIGRRIGDGYGVEGGNVWLYVTRRPAS